MRALLRPLLLLILVTSGLRAAEWQAVSVRKIWDAPPHAAFGDLLRWQDQFYAVFREGRGHMPRPGAPDDGRLRVLVSRDGETWTSEALLEEAGADLRDPHLSVTPEGRLMIVAGGSYYPGGVYASRQSRVFFSKDGRTWSAPRQVVADGDWLWRVTWHRGLAYGVAKNLGVTVQGKAPQRTIRLVQSRDGVDWTPVAPLAVRGGDETTVRFLPDDTLVALVRRSLDDTPDAWIGTSRPPYREWAWRSAGQFIGGPNFIVLPSGRWVGGGRLFPGGDRTQPQTVVGEITADGFGPKLRLPSGGDNSYPGLLWHDGLLWVLYYSSHEGKTSIYLAKVRGVEP